MTDQNLASVQDPEDTITALRSQFLNESEKKQLQLIPNLIDLGDAGLAVLMDFLQEHQSHPPTVVMGKTYQSLHQTHIPEVKEFLNTFFPRGIVPLRSQRQIDYQPIQDLLAQSDYESADRATLEKMCELAGESAVSRGWLYFTEVENFPVEDLQTIDTLWKIYSEGKFGFSVQRKLWRSLGKDFSKLWNKIGWKSGNTWTRYPNGFTWNLSAPTGHLPLSNQLRGVRVIASLFSHPAWTQDATQD